jgi:hypothetical protein
MSDWGRRRRVDGGESGVGGGHFEQALRVDTAPAHLGVEPVNRYHGAKRPGPYLKAITILRCAS